MEERRKPQVVILGGGFGGLYAARALAGAPVRVTVIDRRNFHLFQPMLYQVATASLSPADIASPIRTVLKRQKNADVFMAEALDVDVANRRVLLADGHINYDYLVVATGATHAYFGHPEWEAVAPGLKTIDDATELRRRFLLAFEAAEREADEIARKRLLTFVIIGGGPTGVELAGAMAEIANHALPREFRYIDTRRARIILLEGGPRILPSYTADLSGKAQKQLEKLGVEVRTSALVTDIEENCVHVGDTGIETRNVFWAAGVAASPLGKKLGAETDHAGRVLVEEDLSLPGHPEVFVIGDLARVEQGDGLVPGVCPAAIQMGKYVAKTIRRELQGGERKPFSYLDKGALATIGRNAAVGQIWKLKLSGFLAWITWALVHIMYLIGYRNRVLVMLQWAWAYVFYHRGVRLITGEAQVELTRPREDRRVRPVEERTGAQSSPLAEWNEPAPARRI
jgi:NADH dehydrogenase